jgi:flagellar biosynthesis regulator FlbT
MYKSPIEVFFNDVRTRMIEEQDNKILKAVTDMGINVNKDELYKALQYDRDQYDKGFRDGKRFVLNKMVEFLNEMEDT